MWNCIVLCETDIMEDNKKIHPYSSQCIMEDHWENKENESKSQIETTQNSQRDKKRERQVPKGKIQTST